MLLSVEKKKLKR